MSCGYRGLKDIPRMFLELRDAADAVWITVRSSSKCIERMPRWINGDISEQKTPTPERVPRRPWAKLNRPVPFARSAMTSVVSTPSVAPLRPSSIWMTTSNAGAAVNAKNAARTRTIPIPMSRSGRRPQVLAVRPTHGANSPTMICGPRLMLT